LRVWVGIPHFFDSMAEPLMINNIFSRIIKKMHKKGMPANLKIFIGGHS